MSAEFEQKKNPITLTRLLLSDSKEMGASGDFVILLQSIQLAIKVIASATAKAGISNLYGISGTQTANSSGDVQKTLDVLANDIFVNSLSFCNQVKIMGSEECEEPYILHTKGKYAVSFDPLDGSSVISSNGPTGSIFGVSRALDIDGSANPCASLLKAGRDLVAAGYALYGPSTMLILATSRGVNSFTLDPTIGEFILTESNIKIPSKYPIYSINEGNSLHFDAPTAKYIQQCKEQSFRARYIGSMVGDVHRTLVCGGIFGYPGDKKSPKGKLRLLYEVAPMSFIIEKAGGKATTGTGSPLDVVPTSLHERCPIWLGSTEMVNEIEQLYKELQ